MMSNGSNEKIKIYTQDVPLSQNTEEEVRGKDLEVVWDDTNEWNEETVWKTERKGPRVLKSTLTMISSLSNRQDPSRNTKIEGNETGPIPLATH